MIESAMLIALGFFAATLVSLLILPLVSARAARLAELRLRDLVPLSVSEIAAERDGIRALAAVEQRRLEQKVEQAAAAAAETEAELGRRASSLVEIERVREGERVDRLALEEDLARIKQAVIDAEKRIAEMELAASELQTRLRDEEKERQALQLKHDKLDALAEERRGSIASLETRGAGLEMRLGDRNDELERSRGDQTRLRATISDLTRDRDLARNELLLVTMQRTILQDDFKDLTRRAEDYRARLQARSDSLLAAERQLMEETADRKAADAALTDLRRRFETLEARLIEVGTQAAGQALPDSDLAALRASIVSVADDALLVLAGPPAVGAAAPDTEKTETGATVLRQSAQ